MINALLNLAVQIGLVILMVWLALALLGLKWRLFRAARQGYGKLLKAMAVAVATWLWVPEMKREGRGHIAQASSEYVDVDKEADEWEELEPEGWP